MAQISGLCCSVVTRCECPLWVISGHCRISARCPLYPRKRTSPNAIAMSAMCQKRTSSHLFDHLVGGDLQGLWQRDAERFGSFEVEDQLNFYGLLDRQVTRLFPLKDAANIAPNRAVLIRKV